MMLTHLTREEQLELMTRRSALYNLGNLTSGQETELTHIEQRLKPQPADVETLASHLASDDRFQPFSHNGPLTHDEQLKLMARRSALRDIDELTPKQQLELHVIKQQLAGQQADIDPATLDGNRIPTSHAASDSLFQLFREHPLFDKGHLFEGSAASMQYGLYHEPNQIQSPAGVLDKKSFENFYIPTQFELYDEFNGIQPRTEITTDLHMRRQTLEEQIAACQHGISKLQNLESRLRDELAIVDLKLQAATPSSDALIDEALREVGLEPAPVAGASPPSVMNKTAGYVPGMYGPAAGKDDSDAPNAIAPVARCL